MTLNIKLRAALVIIGFALGISLLIVGKNARAQGVSSSVPTALEEIVLKSGKKSALSATHFRLFPSSCNPMNCDPPDCKDIDCGPRAIRIKLRDICTAAICLPIEAKNIPKILGPDVLHWRVSRSTGTMTQFLGDRPLGNAVKASIPPVLAKPNDVKELPIIGLKNAKDMITQYWVWTK